MSRKLQRASAVALVATVLSILANSQGAVAQVMDVTGAPKIEAVDTKAADVNFISEPVVQPLPEEGKKNETRESEALSLAELISDMPVDDSLSEDLRCLASAIYFEARGEPITGQLAVGDVVVNRAQSGRFPSSYCGVVRQPAQFSFVRKGRIPSVDTSSAAWRKAAAIALIAHESLWESPAKDAMFFHAKYVKPRWQRTRVAQIHSHVFYR